jgi:hypothetical protein
VNRRLQAVFRTWRRRLDRVLKGVSGDGGPSRVERSSRRAAIYAAQLHRRSRSARVFERLRDLFGADPRLAAFLALHNRLSLQLAKVIGIGFHEFRSEAAQSALRTVSSLLESSRKLNQSSASVNAVLSDLTVIVRRLVPCDKSFTFLWRAIERAYVTEASLGVSDRDLATIRRARLRRGDFQGWTRSTARQAALATMGLSR